VPSSSVWSLRTMPSRRPLRGPVRTLNGYDCGLTQLKPDAARWQRDVIPRRAANDLLPALPKADGARPDVAQVVRVSRISHLPMLRLRGDHDDRTRAFSLARTLLIRRTFAAGSRSALLAIKPCFHVQIPADFIGRTLSQDETADLLSMLTIGAGYKALSDQSESAAA
jgi:hypothetical protein